MLERNTQATGRRRHGDGDAAARYDTYSGGQSGRASAGAMMLFAVVLTPAGAAHAQHALDVWVGQSGSSVALSTDGARPGEAYHQLEPVDSIFRGWSNNDPGFDSVNDTGGGVVPLSSSAEIWLEVVRLDPAFYVVDNAQQVLEFPGDATYLGDESLHTHITWLVDRDDPRFSPLRCVWQATFVLFDNGGSIQDSVTVHGFQAIRAGIGRPLKWAVIASRR